MLTEFKTLLRHSLVYGVGIAVGKAVGLIMVPVYTRYLSTSQYGVLELLSRSGELMGLVSVMGLVSALPRFYFEDEDDQRRRAIVATGLVFSLGAGFTLALLLLPFGRMLSLAILGTAGYAPLCQLLVLSVASDTGTLLSLTYLRIQRRSVLYTVVNLVRLVIALGLNIYLIAYLRLGVAGAIWSMFVVSVTLSLLLTAWTLRHTGLRMERHALSAMLRYGLPLIPASLCLLAIQASDRFFLGRMGGLGQVGVYALGYKFAMMVGVLVTGPFMLVWTTYIFEIAKRADAPRVYGRALTYYALVAGACALVVSLFGREIMLVFATPRYAAAANVIPPVALGFVLLGCASVMDVGIYLKRRTGLRAANMAAALAVNLALNYLLVPRLGGMGCALALVGGFGCLAILTRLVAGRLYPVPYEFGRLALLAAVLAAVWRVGLALDATLPLWWAVALKCALLATAPLVLLAAGFLQPEEATALRRLLGRKVQAEA